VLFTRAKKRMHVFSSMGSDDIVLTERSKRGVEALKGFLAFAETGQLHRAISTGKPPDSDFEVAVANALGDAGFQCVPQVGVAGFFIDLAVRDPGSPGRYLMGIECDGATYHSAKSVRDRDRLRQAVLERLGWRIRRIWSTDWYRNPRAEIEPIIRELNALKTEPPPDEPEVAKPPETEQIVELEQQELALDTSIPEEPGLRERLIRFDRKVIRAEEPDTPDNQRLLRPAMLEALLEYRPLTKSEFVEWFRRLRGTRVPADFNTVASLHGGGYRRQVSGQN
jgi:very-short-patch-repair endonuclease